MDNSLFANTFLANILQDYFLSNPFFYSLALTLIHFVWQGFVVAFALKTALAFISHKKPQLRYLLSALAMLISLALPFITFSIIHQAESATLSNLVTIAPLFDINIISQQSNTTYWTTDIFEYLPYLSLSWLIAVFFLATKLLIEVFMVNQLPKQSTMPANKALNERFLKLVAQMQLNITPRLLISLKTQVPMAIGWLKPVVLLPASMLTGLTNAQLEMLILHELAHIRRHDYLVNFLQTLISILLFFHPGVQWISKQMRNEREYCSDDIAVKHCGNAVAYAHTLADTAALCSKHRQHTIPNMAMAASGGDLKQRVVRLVNHHCTPENEAGKWLAATLIIVLVLGIASKQFLTPSLFEFGSNPLSYQQSEKQEPSSLLTTDLAKSSLANYLLSSDVPNFLPPEKSNKVENSNFLTDFSADNTLVLVNKTQTIEPINHLDGLLVKQETISNIALVDNKDKIQAKKKSALIIKKQTTDTVLAQSKNVITDSDKKLTQSNTLLAQTAKVEKLANQAINIATSKITKQEKVLLTKNTRQNNPNASTQVLASPSLKQQKNNASLTIATYTKPKPLETVVADSMAVETISSNVVLSNSMFTNTTLKQTGNANEGINDLYAVENNLFTPLASLPPAVYKAQLIKAVDPKYPATAKRRGIEIEVKVNFTIDVSGRIKDLDFEHQSKVSYFRSSIKSAMQKWAFEPAKKGGKAIESQMSKIFSFSLQG